MSPQRHSLSLPSARALRVARANVAPAPVPSAPPLPASINALVAARDQRTRQVIGQWFLERGHFAAIVDDPEAAETLLGTVRFDLIVCDAIAISLRARRWIEQLLAHPRCPTIFIAAHPTLETAIRVANQPLAAYLPQPLDLAVFDRVVSQFLAAPRPRLAV